MPELAPKFLTWCPSHPILVTKALFPWKPMAAIEFKWFIGSYQVVDKISIKYGSTSSFTAVGIAVHLPKNVS